MCGNALPRATLGRLPGYLEYVRGLRAAGEKNTSATAVARALGLGEVQVRKDLGAVSGAGKPKTGYRVGAGELGRALLNYEGFAEYGTEIVAAFDISPEKTGLSQSGKPIYPMERLEAFLQAHPAAIGIITVPASAAQQVCDRLVESGVRALWNFAPVNLRAPAGVIVQRENLALSLACLNGQRNGLIE